MRRRIESRIAALESRAGVLVDGRDPGIVELCRIVAQSKGAPFDIERVPRGMTVRQLLQAVAAAPGSRAVNLIARQRRRHGQA